MPSASLSHSTQSCPECETSNTVEDASSGDLICRDCGLCFGKLVDDTAEWRSFSEDSSDKPDANRAGNGGNSLLSCGGLTTSIGSRGYSGGQRSRLEQMQASNAMSSSDRHLLEAFGTIKRMGQSMQLSQVITDCANETYRDIDSTKQLKGRASPGIVAACIYIACRRENQSRTFKEIQAESIASKKEIGKCFKLAMKALQSVNSKVLTARGGDAGALGAGGAAQYMQRFCSRLELDAKVAYAAEQVANRVKQNAEASGPLRNTTGKSPDTVAAAIIYLVSLQRSKEKFNQEHPAKGGTKGEWRKRIYQATGVAEVTIASCYRDIYPHAQLLMTSGPSLLPALQPEVPLSALPAPN